MSVHPFLQFVLGLLPDSWIVGAATCGALGRRMAAPGTWGTLVGVLLYTIAFMGVHPLAQFLLLVALGLIAVVITDEAERRMMQRDPPAIVLDEIVATPLCFAGLEPWMEQTGMPWLYILCGFAIFRVYDVVKPFGISKLQNLDRGWGIVADDFAAAFATAVTLHLVLLMMVDSGP